MQVRRISASGAVGAGAGVAEGADANCGHVRECDGDGGWVDICRTITLVGSV